MMMKRRRRREKTDVDGRMAHDASTQPSRVCSIANLVSTNQIVEPSCFHVFPSIQGMASPQSGALGPDMDGEEEYRELSAFLGSQRMQYDELRHVYDEKKRVLQDLKRECKHLQNLSSHNDGQKVTFQAQVQSLDSRITAAKADIEKWNLKCASYQHMKERLVRDKIRMDKRTEELKEITKEADREQGNVRKMLIKQRQLRDMLEKQRRELEKNLEENRERRAKQLEDAENSLDEQRRMQVRKQKREKRRRQIALEVAGDLGIEEEKRLKKLYASKKMQNNMMSQKLRSNDKHMSELQNGFDKIKSVTGFTDLNEIVDKFLIENKTNTALQKALNEMETATDEATKKNKALESRLSELQLEDLSGQGKRNLYKDIDEKDAKVKEAKKCVDQQERAQKCNMILQNIRQCVGKLHAKLNKTKGAVTGKENISKENILPNVDELPSIIGKIEQDVKLMLDDLTHLMPSKSVVDADNVDRESRPASGSIRSNNSSKIDLKKSSPSSKQAADVLFNSIMAVNLDTSPRNVRVPIMTNSAIKSRPQSRATAYSRSSSRSKQSHKIVDEM